MHPKNHVKLTGDTHPPEVEQELLLMDLKPGAAQPEPVGTIRLEEETVVARGVVEPPQRDARPGLRARADAYRGAVNDKVALRPFAAIGAALALGFLVAKLVR